MQKCTNAHEDSDGALVHWCIGAFLPSLERPEQLGGRRLFPGRSACCEHPPVLLCGASRLSRLLQCDAEIQASLNEVGRGGGRALEPGDGFAGTLRLDQEHAESVRRIGSMRVDIERAAI